ncbi:MAG TPA: hypothetical protein VNT54_16365 [Solirubrobacteraceae bacterium]|nr:hypothetical protein [Solirubrobacteraceae bacterium]
MALFTGDFMLDRFQRLHPAVALDRMLTRQLEHPVRRRAAQRLARLLRW